MRKTICLVMALLAPFGVWIAGCRKDTQSARLPGGPETARLARAPASSVGDAPGQPYIPARIDPEIMMSPEQSGQSRVQAMADREAAMYTRHNDAGLYVLPHWGGLAEPQPRQEPNAGSPGRIWSRPVSGGEAPDLTPLQFRPVGDDPVINQLMAMAPGSYPNLDPGMPLGDPTLIPGMYFGPDDLALLGATRVRMEPAAVQHGGERLALPPPITSDSFGGSGITAVQSGESGVDMPILQSIGDAPPARETPAAPAESVQRPAAIKLKPLGEEEPAPAVPSTPLPFAAEERERIDRQLDADLLALPGLPPVATAAPSPGEAVAPSPIPLDLAGMMASPAWQKENETSAPLVIPENAAPAAPPAEAPAVLPATLETPAAPATVQKDEPVIEPAAIEKDEPKVEPAAIEAAIELEDLRFSEIAPPPLPTKDMFADIPENAKKEAVDGAASGEGASRAPEAANASWLDEVKVPGDSRPEGSLQPLVTVDFSLYDWEMKTVPQKLKLSPVKGQPANGSDDARKLEPEAPPLVDKK